MTGAVVGSTVLVTGAGGFIGSAVMRRLVSGESCVFWDGEPVGHVVALARPGGSLERLDLLPRNGRWSVEQADLGDARSVVSILRRTHPRAVLHLGLDRMAYEHVPDRRLDQLVSQPLRGLLEGLSEVAEARFVHTGSAWVLQGGDRLGEDAPLDPLSPYARNKARADALLPDLAGGLDVPWINLRLFNVFGRYEDPRRLLPYVVSKLARGRCAELSHGGQVRDFTDVDVMADVYMRALAAPEEACGAVYHVGSGRGLTVRGFAEAVADVVGRPELLNFGADQTADQGMDCLVADPALAVSRLGWAPQADPRPRIRRAARWWLRQWGYEEEPRGTRTASAREETHA